MRGSREHNGGTHGLTLDGRQVSEEVNVNDSPLVVLHCPVQHFATCVELLKRESLELKRRCAGSATAHQQCSLKVDIHGGRGVRRLDGAAGKEERQLTSYVLATGKRSHVVHKDEEGFGVVNVWSAKVEDVSATLPL